VPDTFFTDISPLSGLTDILFLYLNNNSIIDISPLGGLEDLFWVYLSNNKITDISPLANNLSFAGIYSVLEIKDNLIDCDAQKTNLDALTDRSVTLVSDCP